VLNAQKIRLYKRQKRRFEDMEKYFVVRRKNQVLFIKISDNSMWETTLAEFSYSNNLKTSMLKADIFRNCVNEVLGTNYSQSDLLSLSPTEKRELKKVV
jgi:hypothetical protein